MLQLVLCLTTLTKPQTQKDIPVQFLISSKPVHATVVIASFGSAQGLTAPVFNLEFTLDPNNPTPASPSPVRYGKKPEIHHIFRIADKSPNKAFSVIFMAAALAAVPAMFGTVSYRCCVMLSGSMDKANVFCDSGSTTARTLSTSPRPSAPPLCRTQLSLAPFSPWST